MKKCTKCKETKDETEFYKNKKTKDGLHKWCKICHSTGMKITYKKTQLNNLNSYSPALIKTCSKCNIEKSSCEFSKATRAKDGLFSWCKKCVSDINKQKTINKGASKSTILRRFNSSIKIKSNNHTWVNNLIFWDKLDHPTKSICSMKDCSNQALEYHHLKYDSRNLEDPFSIITPLCHDCHDLFHIKEREGIDLTDKILTQIELEYIPRKKPHIRFIKEKNKFV